MSQVGEPGTPGPDEVVDDLNPTEPEAGVDEPIDEDSEESTEDQPEDDDPEQPEEPAAAAAPAAPAKRSAGDVIRGLKAERKQDRAELETLKRQLNDLQQGRSQAQTEADRQAEAAREALMTPEELYQHRLTRLEKGFNERLGGIQFQMQDSADGMAFRSLAARGDDVGKAYASVADEVESRLSELRRNGGNTTREVLAKYILGERAVARLSRVKGKQQRQGAANIARQTTRAPAGRSDTAPADNRRGGDERAARAKRLENLQI